MDGVTLMDTCEHQWVVYELEQRWVRQEHPGAPEWNFGYYDGYRTLSVQCVLCGEVRELKSEG